MFTKILLCSDGSDHALRAAIAAGELAKRYGSKLLVVQVFAPGLTLAPAGEGDSLAYDAAAHAAVMESAHNIVSRRTGKILEESGISYETRLEMGHPAECILGVAEEEAAELIVLGSRGQSAIQSFLLGSVSDRVVHHAHCPVLIVK